MYERYDPDPKSLPEFQESKDWLTAMILFGVPAETLMRFAYVPGVGFRIKKCDPL